MKYLLIIFMTFVTDVYGDSINNGKLSGNVPEDILMEMEKMDCKPIENFYRLDRTQGGGRIGRPFDDGTIKISGRNEKVTIFGCQFKNSDQSIGFKIIILRIKAIASTREYNCSVGRSTDKCAVIPIREYALFNECSHQIISKSMPGGIEIIKEPFDEKSIVEFTSTLDDGAVGKYYSCIDGDWRVDVIH